MLCGAGVSRVNTTRRAPTDSKSFFRLLLRVCAHRRVVLVLVNVHVGDRMPNESFTAVELNVIRFVARGMSSPLMNMPAIFTTSLRGYPPVDAPM